MPVLKYRSVEEMPGETWFTPGDPRLYRTLAHLWQMTRFLAPRRFPGGLWKHRSVEDMNGQREAWDRAYVTERRSKRDDA